MVLAGCATPDRRIQQNLSLFQSYPADIQEKIRKGDIALGFTQDMVHMSLGRPNHVFNRETMAGKTEVWAYTDTEYRSTHRPVAGNYWTRTRGGRLQPAPGFLWVDAQHSREYDTLRVEFENGKVRAIDRLQ